MSRIFFNPAKAEPMAMRHIEFMDFTIRGYTDGQNVYYSNVYLPKDLQVSLVTAEKSVVYQSHANFDRIRYEFNVYTPSLPSIGTLQLFYSIEGGYHYFHNEIWDIDVSQCQKEAV